MHDIPTCYYNVILLYYITYTTLSLLVIYYDIIPYNIENSDSGIAATLRRRPSALTLAQPGLTRGRDFQTTGTGACKFLKSTFKEPFLVVLSESDTYVTFLVWGLGWSGNCAWESLFRRPTDTLIDLKLRAYTE